MNKKRNKIVRNSILLTTLGVLPVLAAGSIVVLTQQKDIFNSNQKNNLNLLSSTSASSTKYFFKPSSLELNATSENWTGANKYASQITSDQIQKLFTFTKTTDVTSISGSATTNDSGFSFEKLETDGSISTVSNSALFSSFGFTLGDVRQSAISSLIINITEVDNLNGEVFFKVYQPVSGYTKDVNGVVVPVRPTDESATSNPYSKARALITPPTRYASNDDATIWKLPSQFPIKKVEFEFNWAPETQINNFIQTANKSASAVTETDIKRNFYNISLKYNSSDSPTVEIPQPTSITLTPNTNVGRLDVEIALPSNFGSTNSVKKTFFGFPKSGSGANITELNLLSNLELLNSTIKMPYWDETTDPEKSKVSKQVATLLPSEFVRPQTRFGFSFLEIFKGTINRVTSGTSSTASQAALETQNANNAVGWLTYLGHASGSTELNGLPEFKIIDVKAFPNDQDGTLTLQIKYQSIGTDGNLVEAPLASVHYTGFAKNLDSGQALSFAWKNILPSKYASLTANQIVSNFKDLTTEKEQEDVNAFSDTLEAKAFVASFFDSSTFLMNKYNKKYLGASNAPGTDLSSYDGARVKISSAGSTGANDKRNRILVSIQFANFNGQPNYTFDKIFETSQEESTLPIALQSSIKVNPEFLKSNNKFSSKYASDLTLEEIKELIVLEIPNQGEIYTSSLDKTIIFAIPDDRTGKLVVSIIFPLFNKIVNYEFNYVFYNFKINPNLKLNLELTHTPLLNLNSAFLAKNPLDAKSLNETDVLNAVFGSLDANILKLIKPENIKIVERKKDSAKVEIKINWDELISAFDENLPNVTTTSAILNQSENPNSEDRVISFTITGFTGGENFLLTNDTPYVPEAVISFWGISLIGLAITIPLLVIIILFGYKMYLQKRKYKSKIAELEKEGEE